MCLQKFFHLSKNIRKFLLLFCFLSTPLFCLVSEDIQESQKTQQWMFQALQPQFSDLTKETKSSNENLTSQNQSEIKSKKDSEIALEQYQKLLRSTQNLKVKWNLMEQTLKESLTKSQSLETQLTELLSETQNLKENLDSFERALRSNKDDTSFLIKEVGNLQTELNELQDQLEFYKIMYKKGSYFGYVFGAVAGVCLCTAAYGMYKNNSIITGAGAAGFFGSGALYLCGKKFKLW